MMISITIPDSCKSDALQSFTQDQKTNEIVLGGLKKPIDDYVRTHSRLINDVAPMMKNIHQAKHIINHTVRTMVCVLAWMFYLNTVEDDFEQYDKTVNATRGRCVVWLCIGHTFIMGLLVKQKQNI